MEKIEHFSHEHPLMLHEERSRAICDGCQKRIFDSPYSCKECNYDLHKSCAELPRLLQHPLHPNDHPLLLFPTLPYDSYEFKCRACDTEKTPSYFDEALFVYHCPLCMFDLDIKCASLPLTIKFKHHDHPLALMRSLISFTCNACGKEDRGMPYTCGECGFWFHSKCASSPHTVKTILHKHPLKLTHSHQIEQSDHRFCKICVEKGHLDNWVYHCSICDIVVHLICAADEVISDQNFGQESEDTELDESVDSIAYDVKKTSLKGDAIEIKHFSHEHDLILTDNFDNNTKCDGCTRHIFSPFYSCTQCSFFLHKSCVELPKKKRFIGKHHFTLLPKAPCIGPTFKCGICHILCNGFAYNCDKCKFYIDIQCSLTLNATTHDLIHDGHEHPLFYTTSQKLNCNSCGILGKSMFRCAECEFALGFECAVLPHTIWYRQHERPFNLQFAAEDSSGEYYCDICEKLRDPNYWFYYCAEGSFPAHPKCIRGKYPNIKFEKTYTFDFHLHPLTLVKEIKGKAPCDKCGRDCDDLDFECMQCNFKVHRETCLEQMMTNG